jgi:hypothetical protein
LTTYRVADGVLRAELEGEAVLLHPGTGVYHLLNPTGVTVLDGIERDGEVASAIVELAERTGQDGEQVARDVDAFVAALVERRLIDQVDS